ncbi:MAG: DUF1287 domain-containing protein [Planctomycetota bacterium]|nr:DUF1287 domain-containing protein [Planctomycetota bacterium]
MALGYFFVRSLPSTRTRDFVDSWVREYQTGPGTERKDAPDFVKKPTDNPGGGSGLPENPVGGTNDNLPGTDTTAATNTDGADVAGAATTAETVPSKAAKIGENALEQAKVGAKYAPGYFELKYPGGDLPQDKGVCTDVLVRAFRNAGIDLQQLIHEDMSKNFSKYPQVWGLQKPDRNIDHRRNPNLMCFFKRFARALSCKTDEKDLPDWQPGDVVFWRLDKSRLHCGILVDQRNPKGIPLVVHNLATCCLEDCLTKWEIVGHFRYP